VVSYEGHEEAAQTFNLEAHSYPVFKTVELATSGHPGFHDVEAHMRCGETSCGTYHTAFWERDEAYLQSGPKITVDRHYFRVDGQPIEGIGTTYMASDIRSEEHTSELQSLTN